MSANLIVFIILAVVAVGTALGMLFTRNAVYSALYLILNFITVAFFYLTLSAPFIAISQVTVYAGAIMVLFLFVIMLLGAESVGRIPGRWWYQPAALLLGFVLLLETGFIFITQRDLMPGAAALPPGFGSPLAIGRELFIHYLLPFEATSVLLLAALVGAIVLTQREKKD